MIALSLVSVATTANEFDLQKKEPFERMKSLLGDWEKEGGNGEKFHIKFSQTAGGTVVVEDWISRGKSHSLTLYHMDNGSLLATHYCPQGNQPRLQLEADNRNEQIIFSFKDATNLVDLDADHQHSLTFEWLEHDKILRKESYLQNGNITPSTMTLVRK
ncbi:hypothetical protein MO867_01445 [Microbulbifer sp. OS29]|uniref:Uncharacterized protein n=1 Tax=Microbulbifer okhotskensis TaxID=2926617 RepID=A0A9X2ENU0_9GAMM|nr:hypothetical protein [Microbulbifer okhotskensis]MCO1332993.1 hypothetical protein [Microbulbifer okhotskensis]